MIRSEERLTVDVERFPSRGVPIGKRVVTETRTVTVDVRREELYYQECVPRDISGGENETGDPCGPAPFEMVLHEEHIVVDRIVTPVERVRISVGRVDGTVEIAATVARERIAVEQIALTGA